MASPSREHERDHARRREQQHENDDESRVAEAHRGPGLARVGRRIGLRPRLHPVASLLDRGSRASSGSWGPRGAGGPRLALRLLRLGRRLARLPPRRLLGDLGPSAVLPLRSMGRAGLALFRRELPRRTSGGRCRFGIFPTRVDVVLVFPPRVNLVEVRRLRFRFGQVDDSIMSRGRGATQFSWPSRLRGPREARREMQ
jgi:hypothetical protein